MTEVSWRRYLRFWRPNVDADVDDELRFHLEARVEELVGDGMTAESARARALEEFGSLPRCATGCAPSTAASSAAGVAAHGARR